MPLLLVAAGGALGAVARQVIGAWMQGRVPAGFPWGTLLVNTAGSLLLGGFLSAWERMAWSPDVRALVAVGFLGAFTTFSTFSFETLALAQRGEWVRAAAYVLASVTLGLLGVAVGLLLGSATVRPSGG